MNFAPSPMPKGLGGFPMRMRRWLGNLTDRQGYARLRELQDLPHTIFTHQSPLSRPLAGFGGQGIEAKATNLRRACEAIDGLILAPGQAFSFWGLVGRPHTGRGFVSALGPIDGIPIPHMGGGLCQASNLLFWIFAHSPVLFLERWRHAYDIAPDAARTQPFGSGASVVFNHRDLRIKNQTAHTYQIRLWLSPTHLHGALNADAPLVEAIRIIESDHIIRDHGAGHFSRHNRLWRMQGAGRVLLVENNAKVLYTPSADQITAPPPDGR